MLLLKKTLPTESYKKTKKMTSSIRHGSTLGKKTLNIYLR